MIFPEDSTLECVDIKIVDDDEVEETEELEIKLLSVPSVALVDEKKEKAVVTIVDNDEEVPPQMNVIGIQETEYTVSEDEDIVRVCVELMRRNPGMVIGTLIFHDITATEDEGMYEIASLRCVL